MKITSLVAQKSGIIQKCKNHGELEFVYVNHLDIACPKCIVESSKDLKLRNGNVLSEKEMDIPEHLTGKDTGYSIGSKVKKT